MADETQKNAPDSVNDTGTTSTSGTPESGTPGSTPGSGAAPDAGSKAMPETGVAPVKAAARPKKVGGTTKGTTGNPTTTASGQGIDAAHPVKAEEVVTTTGSDPDVKQVYSGEPPMSSEDRNAALRGSDPLSRAVPENDPTGGLGPQAAAQSPSNPFGPTGSVMTGSPHKVQEKALADEKAAEKQGEKDAKDETITPAS